MKNFDKHKFLEDS